MEAMDSAQLGHNIAEGNGYNHAVHPSVQPLPRAKHSQAKTADTLRSSGADSAQIKTAHRIWHPPVYPFVLAGLMKVLPFQYP